MYAILRWIRDDYVVAILNSDGSLKLFDKLIEADAYAKEIDPDRTERRDDTRIISIEGCE